MKTLTILGRSFWLAFIAACLAMIATDLAKDRLFNSPSWQAAGAAILGLQAAFWYGLADVLPLLRPTSAAVADLEARGLFDAKADVINRAANPSFRDPDFDRYEKGRRDTFRESGR